MDYYALHLALAAPLGASFVAVSAYYMRRKTLDQLLELAKTIEKERDNHDEDESILHYQTKYNNSTTQKKKKQNKNSMHDVSVDEDVIPRGLPRLHTLSQGS